MDITILAGGYGTRLRGIWDRPKCLIPYQGRPLIEFLVDKAFELKPRKIFLLLGHKASEVVAWREDCCPHRDVVPIIETWPSGTASAVRNAFPFIQIPLMVLNGDTIPGYDLNKIVEQFDSGTGRTAVAWDGSGYYAGAAIFGAHGLDQIVYSTETDLDPFLYHTNAKHVHVLGFIDVGTPDNFRRVQQL